MNFHEGKKQLLNFSSPKWKRLQFNWDMNTLFKLISMKKNFDCCSQKIWWYKGLRMLLIVVGTFVDYTLWSKFNACVVNISIDHQNSAMNFPTAMPLYSPVTSHTQLMVSIIVSWICWWCDDDRLSSFCGWADADSQRMVCFVSKSVSLLRICQFWSN